jgi:hypothetical protein
VKNFYGDSSSLNGPAIICHRPGDSSIKLFMVVFFKFSY